MTIKPVTMFETKGRQFPTLRKALEFREGLVEEFMRGCPGFQDIPGKQRIAFVQNVLDHRDTLRDLLDFSDKIECDD